MQRTDQPDTAELAKQPPPLIDLPRPEIFEDDFRHWKEVGSRALQIGATVQEALAATLDRYIGAVMVARVSYGFDMERFSGQSALFRDWYTAAHGIISLSRLFQIPNFEEMFGEARFATDKTNILIAMADPNNCAVHLATSVSLEIFPEIQINATQNGIWYENDELYVQALHPASLSVNQELDTSLSASDALTIVPTLKRSFFMPDRA